MNAKNDAFERWARTQSPYVNHGAAFNAGWDAAQAHEKEVRRKLVEALRPCLAILTHKDISPPMLPGVQDRMAEAARSALDLAGETP